MGVNPDADSRGSDGVLVRGSTRRQSQKALSDLRNYCGHVHRSFERLGVGRARSRSKRGICLIASLAACLTGKGLGISERPPRCQTKRHRNSGRNRIRYVEQGIRNRKGVEKLS